MSTSTKANNLPDTTQLDAVTKSAVLLEALPYIQRFRGSKFVIKYGGSFMDDPDPRATYRVITDMVFLAAVGIEVIIVHGGGKAISRAMEAAGLEAVFKHGMRVTDAEAVKVVEKVLCGEVNGDICSKMQARGGLPMGLPGTKIFTCEKLLSKDPEGNPVDHGFVGSITAVNADRIDKYLKESYTPVISPVGKDANGQRYNINADVAAAAVAKAVHARRLVYMSDVPGLLKDPTDPSSLISTLNVAEVDALKASGVISSGMLPKVDSAVEAIQSGVRRVHFIDGRMPHSLLLEIFTHKGIGTEIVKTQQPWKPQPLEDTETV